MEVKTKSNAILLLFAMFLSLSSATPYPSQFQTQTLVLHSLPNPPTLSWPEPETIKPDQYLSSTTLSLPIHHIDSLSFNKTPEKLFHLKLQRDAARVKILTSMISKATSSLNQSLLTGSGFSSPVISGLSLGSGEYVTRLGVGTPPRHVYMILDTGSDVVWLQCAPCKKCYNQTDPIFDPKKSPSFARIPCMSPLCRQLELSSCNRNVCQYQVSYGDGSFTVGDFATETLTFRRASVARAAFGCGHDNEGLLQGAAGLLGLGRGKLSFPAQTGTQFNQKFSYCFVDRYASNKSSSIVFGDSAFPRTARFTPLLKNPKIETFYYVELLGISVGDKPVRGVSGSTFRLDRDGNGGVIIDSGTAVTRLTSPAYIALRDAFLVGSGRLRRSPKIGLFDTCFNLSGLTTVKVPKVVLHFRGADVELPAANYLIPVDNSGTYCFAFAGEANRLSIIGNIQQQGFRVMYDLAGSRVGFAPGACD